MFLVRKDEYKTRLLVSVAAAIMLFFFKFYQKPIKHNITLLLKFFSLLIILMLSWCISFLVGNEYTKEIFLLLTIIGIFLIIFSPEGFPIWLENPEIITLWQKDNRFLMTMHLENASQESTLQENPPPEPLPQIASKETQDLLLQELNLYTDNPTQKQEEILRLFNKKLEVLTLPLKGKTTAKRYTILPKEERYSYPSLDEIYWLNKKGLRLLKKHPSLLFKYLRLPLDMDNQHFQVFEITLKEGEKTIVFNGEVEHGDKHWQESEYAAIIDYYHEMSLSVVLDKSKWSSPKLIEEFYVGI